MLEFTNESLDRIKKLERLKNAGVIPYANKFSRTHTTLQLRNLPVNDVDSLMQNWAEEKYFTAWRIVLFRSHGKLSFAKIKDGEWEIQLCFVKDTVKFNTWREILSSIQIDWEEFSAYKIMEKLIDMADWIGVSWDLFVTKHGELTLFVNTFQLLSKAIRPLPEKFHWLQDIETAYRQRYLDLIMNDSTYDRFLLRSKFIQYLRQFYWENWFIEIETPVMGSAASWAAAKPFITHHNDFDQDFYLRISPETNLKKSTVWRFEKVFEIGKQFRNEWSDPSHMQEFTSVEHYAVYWNFEDNIKFTEKMFDYLFDKLNLPREIEIKDKNWVSKLINFTTPWERIDYVKWVEKVCGIDVSKYEMSDDQKLRNDIKAAWVEFEGMDKMGTTTLIDYLYKKVLRPSIVWPAIVYNYPKVMQPLARVSDENIWVVEQFQVVVNGWEILKAYSELVDPIEQKVNFDAQSTALERWDEEATASDDDFVLAMEYGMPPQSGWGMWIDRILSLITQQDNLRDAVLFPLMKPIVWSESPKKSESNAKSVSIQTEVENFGNVPSVEDGFKLVDKYATATKNHLIAVGYVMRHFAEKLWKNADAWQLVGMLHDIDRDIINKDASKHCKEELDKICAEISLPVELVDAIKSHWHWLTWVKPDTVIRKYICATDELTGFIVAVAKMMPNKSFEEVKVSSVIKKIKDKTFAAWVSRDEVLNCETMLWIKVEDFIQQVLEALVKYKEKISV